MKGSGERGLALSILPETFGICRLGGDDCLPGWVLDCGFFSVTRTEGELSILAPQSAFDRNGIPGGASFEGDWRCLVVDGPLDLSLVGVLASLSGTLSDAGVPLFAVSTYDTDYLLVGDRSLDAAVAALTRAGHAVRGRAEA